MEDIKLLKYTVRGLNARYNALKQINTFLGEAKDLFEYLDNVLEIILEATGAEAGMVLTETVAGLKISGFRAELPYEKEADLKNKLDRLIVSSKDSGISDVFKKEKIVVVTDIEKGSLEYRQVVKEALGGISSLVMVPVKMSNSITGIIEIINLEGDFGDDIKETLISIGSHLGVYVDLFERLGKVKKHANALKTLTSLTEAINTPNERDQVIDIILQSAERFFNADGCAVFLKNKNGEQEFSAVSGSKAGLLKGKKLEKGEGIVGWVIQNEESVCLKNAHEDSRFSPKIDEITDMETDSVMCITLKMESEVTGAIEVVRVKGKKPFSEEDLGMMMVLASHASIAIHKAYLVEQRDKWFNSTVDLICKIVSIRDNMFSEHVRKVRKYVMEIGLETNLGREELQLLDIAASVQDIGKLIIPEKILEKESELSEIEWDEIRKHPVACAEILEDMVEFKDVVPIVKYHHERYDGSGYPEGLAGGQIPRLARILMIADAYSAMVSPRPYRKTLTHEQARKQLEKLRGKQFDPDLVDDFIRILERNKNNQL